MSARPEGGDLAGRTAVVTGANRGLGLAVAAGLARRGASVVLACRDPERGMAAAARCAAVAPGTATPSVESLDLGDLASVRRLAGRLGDTFPSVDILVANAGLMAVPRMFTADGFEMQMGVNHLGHFALTGLLLPLLRARPGARIVGVTSVLGARGTVVLDDLMGDRAYDPWGAYAQSKLANHLTAVEADRRLRQAGLDVTSVAAHPGLASTDLVANGPGPWLTRSNRVAVAVILAVAARRPAAAARSLLLAATGPAVVGGALYGPGGPGQLWGRPGRRRPPRRAGDPDVARRLWDRSEDLTGVSWSLPPVP